MEWSFDLQDNTQYQLMIITHNSIGQTTSDPFVISKLKIDISFCKIIIT